jgi:hypothetical protein
MPMKNFSTRCMDKMLENSKGKNEKNVKPCKQTLMLLTQFARVYHVEPVIPKEFCGLVVN